VPGALARRLDPAERYGLRLTLFAVAFALVAIPFGWLLVQVTGHGTMVRLDTSAANHLHQWVRGSPGTVTALEVVTFFGQPPWLALVVAVSAVLLWRGHRRRLVAYLLTTAVIGSLLDTAVKLAVNRPRPSLRDPVATAVGKSFPSGHAMSSAIVYGALVLIVVPVLPRARRSVVVGVAVLVVLAIGFSRLALGVHYISDVLGGYVLGLAWLAAATAAFGIWRHDRGGPPAGPREAVSAEMEDEPAPLRSGVGR